MSRTIFPNNGRGRGPGARGKSREGGMRSVLLLLLLLLLVVVVAA